MLRRVKISFSVLKVAINSQFSCMKTFPPSSTRKLNLLDLIAVNYHCRSSHTSSSSKAIKLISSFVVGFPFFMNERSFFFVANLRSLQQKLSPTSECLNRIHRGCECRIIVCENKLNSDSKFKLDEDLKFDFIKQLKMFLLP